MSASALATELLRLSATTQTAYYVARAAGRQDVAATLREMSHEINRLLSSVVRAEEMAS